MSVKHCWWETFFAKWNITCIPQILFWHL